MPNVEWKTPDDGQRNCPKHVEFLDNKIWEISASVGFIKKKFVMTHGHMNVKNVCMSIACKILTKKTFFVNIIQS